MIEPLLECFCHAVVVNEFLTSKTDKDSLIRRNFQGLQCFGIACCEGGEDWNQLLIVMKESGKLSTRA